MAQENLRSILYEIAKSEKDLTQEQLNIVLLMTKTMKLENEYLQNLEQQPRKPPENKTA